MIGTKSSAEWRKLLGTNQPLSLPLTELHRYHMPMLTFSQEKLS